MLSWGRRLGGQRKRMCQEVGDAGSDLPVLVSVVAYLEVVL